MTKQSLIKEDILYGTLSFSDSSESITSYAIDNTLTTNPSDITIDTNSNQSMFTISPGLYTSTYVAPYIANMNSSKDMEKLKKFIKKHNIKPVSDEAIIALEVEGETYSLIDVLIKTNSSNPLTIELLVKTMARLSKDIFDTSKQIKKLDAKLNLILQQLPK